MEKKNENVVNFWDLNKKNNPKKPKFIKRTQIILFNKEFLKNTMRDAYT